MLFHSYVRPLSCVSVLLSVIVSSHIVAEEKVAIRLNIQGGESWAFDRTMDMKMTNKGTSEGQTQTFVSKMTQHRVGKMVVVAATDGKPTEVKVTFDKSCDSSMEMTGQPPQK